VSVIEVGGLRKSYGDVEAVRGIDLHVERGEVFALLGPNGAGKTTTTEILEGFRRRTAGEVSVLGHDPERNEPELKARIGIVLQSAGVDPFLTVRETVEMYGGYYEHPRPTAEVIELVGLKEKADTRVNKLSGGQQRRLDVAVALSGDPELLFLDEPTTGFDPNARHNAWGIVRSLTALGKTVFLTTHYMEEAQRLADRVAIVKDGRIVASGPPAELAGERAGVAVIRLTPPADLPALSAPAVPGARGTVEVRTERAVEDLAVLTGWARERGFDLPDLTVTRPTLEDVYLELTA
jgi:ABC-2 type transport system ATP-binding protein